MPFDAHRNLAISTVVTPPAPATSGGTLRITLGEGVRFPAAPFNATVWPASQPPTPANAEVVRVNYTDGDAGFNITRAVEGSTARSIVAGDLIAATITAKVITDIESGTNFPLITTPGAGTFGGNLTVGAGNSILVPTNDGADTGFLGISGGGAAATDRGAVIYLQGNEKAGQAGVLQLLAGNVAGGRVEFYTGPTALRGAMHGSGAFSWGTVTDPGGGLILVSAAGATGGELQTTIGRGNITTGTNVTGAHPHHYFFNPNGNCGNITTSAAATQYNTTSDQRLKTDRGLITDPEVLRSTRVHHFTWNTDNTPGRGVFAQEAIAVLPSAVSIGTDERDDDGRLKQPWGVDYSKFVPDLIAGWQYHDRSVEGMRIRLAYLEHQVTALRQASDRPPVINLIQRIRTAIRAFGQWWRPSWV